MGKKLKNYEFFSVIFEMLKSGTGFSYIADSLENMRRDRMSKRQLRFGTNLEGRWTRNWDTLSPIDWGDCTGDM